jgi:hypothetical protein
MQSDAKDTQCLDAWALGATADTSAAPQRASTPTPRHPAWYVPSLGALPEQHQDAVRAVEAPQGTALPVASEECPPRVGRVGAGLIERSSGFTSTQTLPPSQLSCTSGFLLSSSSSPRWTLNRRFCVSRRRAAIQRDQAQRYVMQKAGHTVDRRSYVVVVHRMVAAVVRCRSILRMRSRRTSALVERRVARFSTLLKGNVAPTGPHPPGGLPMLRPRRMPVCPLKVAIFDVSWGGRGVVRGRGEREKRSRGLQAGVNVRRASAAVAARRQ